MQLGAAMGGQPVRASKRFAALVPMISIVSVLALPAQAQEPPRKPEAKGGPARPAWRMDRCRCTISADILFTVISPGVAAAGDTRFAMAATAGGGMSAA